MRPISLAGTRHVRALSSTDPELVLLVLRPNPDDPASDVLRLALNTDDVVYPKTGGDTYSAFSFELDDVWDESTGQLQEVRLQVCNVNRMVEGYMQEYGGGVGASVELITISMADPDGDPLQYLSFEIVAAQSDAAWATFTLGAASPMTRKFPKFDYRKDYCMWKYKGAQCGYAGALATCDHSKSGANGCDAHSNTLRFGAFPMIDSKGIFTASPV